ncbi:MAG: hypothetical protein ACFE0J_09200 [Elainellaceae cyanobacterium]
MCPNETTVPIQLDISSRVRIESYNGESSLTVETEYRGDVNIKNFSQIDAFLSKGIKADLPLDPAGMLPNQRFIHQYLDLLSDATSVPIFCQWAEAKLAG